MTKTDMQLKTDIEAELGWDPKVNAAQIGVSVDRGAVTLLGVVDTYAQRWAAEDATKRVSGVRAFAQDLTVKLLGEHKRTDAEIATAVQAAFGWNVTVPRAITAKVTQGMVTLDGEATWNFERDAAERAVRCLAGVIAVANHITLKPQLSAGQVREKVSAALQRQAVADTDSIQIETAGSKVTLSGHAASFRSLEDAANAAWAAPGVTEVVDRMTMSSY